MCQKRLRLIKLLSKELSRENKDSEYILGYCYYLYPLVRPGMDKPIKPLAEVVNNENLSNEARYQAVAVLSKIGGHEVIKHLVLARPISPGTTASKKVGKAIFDAIEGKILPSIAIDAYIKEIGRHLGRTERLLYILPAIANIGEDKELLIELEKISERLSELSVFAHPNSPDN
jgi:hypothetical protein